MSFVARMSSTPQLLGFRSRRCLALLIDLLCLVAAPALVAWSSAVLGARLIRSRLWLARLIALVVLGFAGLSNAHATQFGTTVHFNCPGAGVTTSFSINMCADTVPGGFPIAYSSLTPGPCTVTSDGTITGVNPGTCSIVASTTGGQIGADTYSAAQTTISFPVGQKPQSIAFICNVTGVTAGFSVDLCPQSFDVGGGLGGTATPATVFPSPVTLIGITPDVCTITLGSTVVGVSSGICTIVANAVGNATYSAAPQKTLSITVGQKPQSIGFNCNVTSVTASLSVDLCPQSFDGGGGFGGTAPPAGAFTSPVTLASITPNVCTVTPGGLITGVSIGTCTVVANAVSTTTFSAATQVTKSISVTGLSQSISFGSAPAMVVGGTATVSATGGASGNAVTFASTTPSVCAVSGATVNGVSVGTCTIAANQAGNATYSAAAQATINIPISPGATTTSTTTTTSTSTSTTAPTTTSTGASTTTTTGGTTTTTASTTTTTLAGGTAANLVSGWNLLGNGLSGAITVSSTFGDQSLVSTVWKWIASSGAWAFYTPALSDGGAAYAAGKGYAFLSTISGGEGFWVNAKGPFTLQLSGNSVPTTTFADSVTGNALPQGWSLIAIGDNKTPWEFANTITANPPPTGQVATSVTTLWAWDASWTNWYFYAPSLVNAGTQAAYIAGKGYLDFGTKTLGNGTGFWVNKP